MISLKHYLSIICIVWCIISFSQNSNIKLNEEERAANTLMRNGEYDEAIAAYKKILENRPNEAYFLNNIGLCYFNQYDYETAKDYFRLATLYGNDVTYYANLSAAYNYLNNYEKCFEYAYKALEIKANEQTIGNAITAAINLDKPQEAIIIFEKYKDSYGINSESIMVVAGDAYFDLQQYWESAHAYERFFELYSPHNKMHVDLVNKKYQWFFSKMMYYAEATSTYQNMEGDIEISDDLVKIFDELMNSEYKESIIEVFLYTAINATMLLPKSKSEWGQLARYYKGENNFERIAIERYIGNYEKSLAICNEFINAYENEPNEEKLKEIQVEKFITLLYQYNDKVILENKSDKSLQDEILTLQQQIIGNQNLNNKKHDANHPMEKMSECTLLFLKNQLFNYQNKDQREFSKKILLQFNIQEINENIEKGLDRLEEKGDLM